MCISADQTANSGLPDQYSMMPRSSQLMTTWYTGLYCAARESRCYMAAGQP